MNVLGLFAFGENPAACLVRDGELISFAEEERFNRLKTSKGFFPSRAVAWCLAANNLTLADIDRIAFGWDVERYPWKVGARFAQIFLKFGARARRAHHIEPDQGGFSNAVSVAMKWHPRQIRFAIHQGLRAAGLSGAIPPIEFVPHHLAHAYSVFPLSGFERAGIITIDGSGEETATQLAVGEGDSIRVVESIPMPHSLGWFFAMVTQYLGFIPYRDEGKLMGLAALGEERSEGNKWLETLSRVLKIYDGAYEVDPTYTHFGGHFYGDRFTDAFADLIMRVDPDARPIAYGEQIEVNGQTVSRYLHPTYIDLAWAAQELLEQAAISMVRRLVRDHGIDKLCVAGGVGLNCKMNGELLRRSDISEIFVQPAAYDSGAALGAALYVSKELGATIRRPFGGVYKGPDFDNAAIRRDLEAAKVKYTTLADPAAEAAKRLAADELVGWFQGPMEFGARALGGRSILGNPLNPRIRDLVNDQVKFRESWRPFCPSTIAAATTEYIHAANDAAHMIVAYEATDTMAEVAPALVHVDGTIRPQVVNSDFNPLFHSLIETFGHNTGHPLVLNTSLNVRGEPIVCTPMDALRCFFSNGLDVLVMGDFLVTK